jgi:unsaturated chondroitin disaccharide hydrolase
MPIRFTLSCLFLASFLFQNVAATNGQTLKNTATAPVLDIGKQLKYCEEQASKNLSRWPEGSKLPRSIAPGTKVWKTVNYKDWTSGFWPGELWYLYDATKDEKWKKEAGKFTLFLLPLTVNKANDHDLGFQVNCSFGNGYRLTQDPVYKEAMLRTADSLARLFNPKVGTILSWPNYGKDPEHNTIIDNMMNLELLFWASKNGGSHQLYDIAVKHAETTMKNHFRADYSAYHVVVYDKNTGKKLRGVTAQGFSNESMWARGQAWAIYGYTMVYRETKNPKFLDLAQKVAKVYLDRLPKDLIPYWDFNAPGIPNEPRDASAAAITASALLELSTYTPDKKMEKTYIEKARGMLAELSNHYQSGDENNALLLHATGHKPAGTEIDNSIIYADYYYLEALLRLQKLENK